MSSRGKDPDSSPAGSPTVYRADRESWVAQGWRVTDPEALAQMDIPGGGTAVEIPDRMIQLFRHMARWEAGEPDDLEWLQGWCATLREHVRAGKDIRWVPRRLVSSVALPGNDFYLFDDRLTSGCAGQPSRPRGSCRSRTLSTSPSSSARQAREALGARLREVRQDAGLSGRALAAATGQHFTRVSKIENGVRAPSDLDIRNWCRACAAEQQIPDLIATARAVESAYLEFRRQAQAGMKRVLGAHTLQRYQRTGLFRIYEHNVIPGLFQTAAYSAAMLSFWIGFLEVANDIDAAVTARMDRQRVIYQRGKRFEVVLEEQELELYARMFDHLNAPAVHRSAARALIIKALGELS